jgi:1,4-dihydroxy-2-naphthoyl-CoA hydrolase
MIKPIWFAAPDLSALNGLHAHDINGHLGIEVTGFGADWLAGRMPVDARTRQPIGILHGGASVVLAETLGSAAANLCVDPTVAYCVGQEVNANHLRAVTEGYVTAVTRPFHLGRTSQVWSVEVTDGQDRPTCIARLTIAVVLRRRTPEAGGDRWN